MKKTTLAALLLTASTTCMANSYYLVVPFPSKAGSKPPIELSLSSYALPQGEVGVPYPGFDFKSVLQVKGDASYAGGGVTWSIAEGSLPAGLTLNSDGILSGTPSAAGTESFSVKAAYKTKSGLQAYQLAVVNISVQLATGALPLATIGSAFSYDLNSKLAITGDPTYVPGTGVSWSLVSGSLPPGLSLSSSGQIAGTASEFSAQGASFTAKASYRGKFDEESYTILPADPGWSSTVTLLKFDGTPGSSLIVDEKGNTYTSYGVTLSNTSKFQQSGYFPGGAAEGISGPPVNLIGDFTLEGWINPAQVNGLRPLVYQWSQVPGYGGYGLSLVNGVLHFYLGSYSEITQLMAGGSVTPNTWTHIAVTRKDSTFRIFVNGTQVASAVFNVPGRALTVPVALGNYYNRTNTFGVTDFLAYSGYMDEVRITSGLSRYNSNFTVSAYPFPGR